MMRERFSEVSIETLPPLRVACFRAASRTPEEDAAKVLDKWTAEAGIRATSRHFGFEVEVSPGQTEAGLRSYELWYEVPPGVVGSGPVEIRDFPGGRFAALTIHEPFEDPFTHIPAGWNALYDWVVAEGLAQAELGICLEEVVARDGKQDMILYHPVR